MADLKPCPFCGGEPSVRVPGETDGFATHVRCRCGAELYGKKAHFRDADDAIAAWNTRATERAVGQRTHAQKWHDTLRSDPSKPHRTIQQQAAERAGGGVDEAPGSQNLRTVAKRNLGSLIRIGSTDKELMLRCLEVLS